ncbi:MAG: hypothetical protein LBM41_05760 [Ruminococcus sp.]|jgi:hypothetical protein|nr:hypothetical protein [Ruminococcus sp.]
MIASEKGIIKRKPKEFIFKVRTKDQLEAALTMADYVIVPPSLYKKHKKIWLCPPRWGDFTLPKGVTDIYAQNVGHLMYDAEIHAGFGLNIINNEAASFLSDFGVNDITAGIEATKKDILRMKCDILTVYAYGRFPLMLIRQKMKGNLIDRTGRRFPIADDEILNSVKLSLAGKEVNADRLLFDFYDETPRQMNIALDNRENITRGLYGF